MLLEAPRGAGPDPSEQGGDWAKRGRGSEFGFKLHAKTDTDLGLIRDLEATTASVHDSRVDLSREGEVVYRDKGYFGVKPRGFDATMRRGVRGLEWGLGGPGNQSAGGSGGFEAVFSGEFGVVPSSV
jgi:IS5 family transposase